MATVRGCAFPDHLRYDLRTTAGTSRWATARPDRHDRGRGALGGEVLAFTPKRVGRRFAAGRSYATIESGKWIGQAPAAFAGTVVALNDALIQRSSLQP